VDARFAHNPHHNSQRRYNYFLCYPHQRVRIQLQRKRFAKYAIRHREYRGDYGVYLRNLKRLLEMAGDRLAVASNSTGIMFDVFPPI
jgi:hypothetical protein